MKKIRAHTAEETIFGDLLAGIALTFLDVPYKEATLEGSGRENLVVNFRQFDCFTLCLP